MYAFVGSSLVTAISWNKIRRGQWTMLRGWAVGSGVAVPCFMFGEYRSFVSHAQFHRLLENPDGFQRALQNVRIHLR
jgi:roadblock/LC7 domain-containing protein